MKSDMEILHEYIDEYDKDFYNSLTEPEKFLYLCQIRDTLSFSLYLVRYRILEFANKIAETLKGL